MIPPPTRGTLAPVSPISAPGLAGEPNAVPERVVRACGRIAEALFHDGDAPPPAERIAWLEGDVRDFLGRATGRARLMFRLCVFVIVWLGPLWALSLPPLTRRSIASRIAVLERLERSPLGFAFFGAKALLCLMYYEHPDAARELGFDGHASGVARPASSLVRGKR